jgi:hypothetical protein
MHDGGSEKNTTRSAICLEGTGIVSVHLLFEKDDGHENYSKRNLRRRCTGIAAAVSREKERRKLTISCPVLKPTKRPFESF